MEAIIALILALIFGQVPPPEIGEPKPATGDFPPCIHEDGPAPCYWDASARGNGEGRSFTLKLRPGSDWQTCITYWDGEPATYYDNVPGDWDC